MKALNTPMLILTALLGVGVRGKNVGGGGISVCEYMGGWIVDVCVRVRACNILLSFLHACVNQGACVCVHLSLCLCGFS